ncbi:MAG: hypothetical protein CSB21_01585 [Deltaproteobacteria bacterium]|nr:MAG: hypothetical protein CSB21_01585 [Deltaproteobacteria bacterium]
MGQVTDIIKKTFFFFLGSFKWTPPLWLSFFKELKRKKPKTFASFSFLITTLLIFTLAGCLYLASKNGDWLEPVVSPPLINEPGKGQGFVEIGFIKKTSSESETKYQSVANIKYSGKKLEEGVSISPLIKGSFEWKDDKVLVFYPSEKWDAGQKYQIIFKKSIFSKNVKIKNYRADFKTSDFKCKIEKFRFYTNPENRKIHKGVATLSFNYPVDPDSLKKRLFLKIGENKINYELKFGRHGRIVHIHSDLLKIHENKNFLNLELEKGIATTSGGQKTKDALKDTITIPSMESFFKVSEIYTRIIRDEKNNPVQSIILSFTDMVALDLLKKNVKIWCLPKKKNKKRWNSPAEVSEALLDTAVKVLPKFAQTEKKTSNSFGIILDLPENTEIYISINSGIKSESGFYLTKKFNDILSIPFYPKELEIAGSGGILSLSGTRKLSFKSRGVKSIKVEISRLIENQIQHLVSQGTGDINKMYFSGYYFDEDNISERFTTIIPLNMKNRKEAVYSSLDLSGFLDQNGKKPGFFFIKASGWDPVRKVTTGPVTQKSVLVTDLLLLVKKNADNSRDVFVNSILKGSPVHGAEISIIGKNGRAILSQYSNRRGHVHFGSTENYSYGYAPVACTAKLGNDISFIELGKYNRKINLSNFDTGGERSRYMNPDRVDGFLFSDRGIYRPGEKFNIGAIVRHKGFKVPSGIPVEYAVYDSRGNKRLKKRIKVPASGFFDISYKTEQNDPTGKWNIELYIVSNGYLGENIGSESIRVETFQPDRLKIKSLLSKKAKGWIKPKNLKAYITLLNLFGTPAQNRKVTAKVMLQPSGFHFKKFKNYKFTDPFYSPERKMKSVNKNLGKKITDQKGKTSFDTDLDSYERGTYLLTLEVRGYEKGDGRSVTAINKALVSPLDYIVGYHSNSNLSYLQKKSAHKINFIAVNNSLEKTARDNLVLKIKKIKKVAALVKKNDGTYVYEQVEKEELQSEKPFSITKKGNSLTINTKSSGNYAVELYDKNDLVSRVEYFVAGKSNESGAVNKNPELLLKLKNKDIKAGEYMELQINAPYSGTGLITVESNKVYAYKWFNIKHSETTEKIKIPEKLEGNAYICVSMLRAYDDPSIFNSPFTYAVKPFYIDKSSRVLSPKVSVSEKIKPGDELIIKYSTPEKAKLALFAADQGILQVADYKTPAPLNHFLKKKALEVKTFQMADLVLPEYEILRKTFAPGGGTFAKSALLAANLNPFQRTINTPAVKWFGILDSEKKAKKITWTVPDTFNGKIKVIAVAANSRKMGSSSNDVLVRGPFVITPSMPEAVTFGDKFTISLNVSNLVENSGKALPVWVSIVPKGDISISGEKKRLIKIDENSEGSVSFEALAGKNPGNVSFKFHAESENKKSQTSASLSIRPASPYKITMESGISKNESKEISIKRKIIKPLSSQTIKASASPLILAESLLSWLDDFPYICTEQLVSKAFPVISFSQISGFNQNTGYKYKKNIEQAFKALRQRQSSNGGFSLWPASGEVNDFASLYSIHFLIEAKEAGYNIPEDLLQNSIPWLDDISSRKSDSDYLRRIRSYGVYLMTRLGIRTSNQLADIEDKLEQGKYENDIINVFLGASYKLLKDDYSADKKIKKYTFGKGGKDNAMWFSANVTDPLYIYILGKHFPLMLQKISMKQIKELLEPVFKGEFNTLSSAMTILALSSWTDSNQNKPGMDENFVFESKNLAGNLKKLKLTDSFFKEAKVSVDAEKVNITGSSPYFYTFIQKGYDKDSVKEPVAKKIEIIREFQNMKGEKITTLVPGEDFNVVLKIRSLTGKTENNIAVIDLFAGGFYPDLGSIRKNTADYIDVREDRAVFYSSFEPEITTIKYAARASSRGEFTIPSVQAKSLYDPELSAITEAGKIIVK